jgi:hypothetical protein
MIARRGLRRFVPPVALVFVAACEANPKVEAHPDAPSSSVSLRMDAATASVAVPFAPVARGLPLDSVEETLARGQLQGLRFGARGGLFDGAIDGPSGPMPCELRMARLSAPRAYRAELSFHHLARALEVDLVPKAALRAVSVGELAALAKGREARAAIEQAAVTNDGTVDVLVRLKPRADLHVVSESDRTRWAEWAASPTPVSGEDPKLVASFVIMQVLDYLAGNVARRRALLDEQSGALVLLENDAAFPLHLEAHALDKLITSIRSFRRFPKGMLAALRRLDRPRALAIYSPGAFDTWLLPPRTLIELDERRASVITLIEARIAERDEASVLSL